jgi:hypothetical protein
MCDIYEQMNKQPMSTQLLWNMNIWEVTWLGNMPIIALVFNTFYHNDYEDFSDIGFDGVLFDGQCVLTSIILKPNYKTHKVMCACPI